MRVIFFDCDTLRPDHLGCYGYHRNTSPNIDAIAADGVRFNNYYVTDAPCLPSRSALLTGQYGIHNGVVNHGGWNADPMPEGRNRGFTQRLDRDSFFGTCRRGGLYTVSISPFGERHSAWQWYAGLNEMYNPAGKCGQESAEDIEPTVQDWLTRNADRDDWFLHVNFWDPHTPYRAPAEFGNPFENDPPPDWMTQEKLDADRANYGTHSPQDMPNLGRGDRAPGELKTLDDWHRWIDGYDCGIRYMDEAIGRILDTCRKQGIYEDLVIIVSADHGENHGELNVYGDHHTADQLTSRIPMIVRWPGKAKAAGVDDGLHYQIDLLPTLADIFDVAHPDCWDGQSYASALADPNTAGRDSLVVSQMAWSCQRSVRWEDWLLIRTYHTGLKPYPPVMLFDVAADPHELNDLADAKPEVVNAGLAILEKWHAEQMAISPLAVDPLQTILHEGGPYHTRGTEETYCQRLRETGRGQFCETILKERNRLLPPGPDPELV